MEEDEVRIVYVPGDRYTNRYNLDSNTIILDETLKQYPAAHDIILEHELEHAEHCEDGVSFLNNLMLELRTDWCRVASTSDDAKAIRRYLKSDNNNNKQTPSIKMVLVNIIRQMLSLVIIPVGLLIRAISILRTVP